MKRHGIVPTIVFALALAGFPGLATALEVGDKAPDFELPSTQGAGKFKLSDFAGKKNVIVQFYVLDFTPT
jgi:thioredoxin-dependent peroxiredoxin